MFKRFVASTIAAVMFSPLGRAQPVCGSPGFGDVGGRAASAIVDGADGCQKRVYVLDFELVDLFLCLFVEQIGNLDRASFSPEVNDIALLQRVCATPLFVVVVRRFHLIDGCHDAFNDSCELVTDFVIRESQDG